MEPARSSEMSVSVYQSTRTYTTEDGSLHSHSREVSNTTFPFLYVKYIYGTSISWYMEEAVCRVGY
jgi:hypothetical protein